MSSIPNNGLVTVSLVPDRSAVDSYLAELRKGITIPARLAYEGPAGPTAGSGPSAASVAGSNGPATFGNLAGAPVYGSGPGGAFMGGPAQGQLGASMYVAGMGYGGGGGGGAGGNTLQPAATALQQAAMELKAAAAGMKAVGAVAATQSAVMTVERAPFLNMGDVAEGAPFLNMSDVVDGPASARPSGRTPGGRGGGTRRYSSVRNAMYRMLGETGGVMGAAGAWAGYEALTAVGGEDLHNAQSQRMAAMGGATPSEMASVQLQHLQNIRSGGLMGSNQYLFAAGEWMARQGFNPGGIFTKLSNAEALESMLAQSEREGGFLNETRAQERGFRASIEQAGQVNPLARQRMQMLKSFGERQIGIGTRFGSEANRYRAAAKLSGPDGEHARDMLRSLNASEDDEMTLSYNAGQAEIKGFDRDAAIQYQAARQNALTSAAVAGHLMRGSGDLALRARVSGQLREFDTTAASKFADTPEGNAAREAARGNIIQQGNLEDFQRQQRSQMMQLGLGVENRVSEIQTSASSPQMGRMLGNVAGIGMTSAMNAYRTSRDPNVPDNDKPKIERMQIHQGQLQLEEFRQSWFRSNEPRQIQSIGQQALNGAGTAKSSDVNEAITKMAAQLGLLVSAAGGIQKAVDDFVQSWN